MKTIIISIILSVLCGCASIPTQERTLYDALGGQTTIDAISAAVIKEISYSKDIRPYFAQTNIKRFQSHLSQHLCMVTDGPCTSDGDSMAVVHAGMNITEADFNTTVDLVTNAMDSVGVSFQLQNKVLARLAPMRKDIFSTRYHLGSPASINVNASACDKT